MSMKSFQPFVCSTVLLTRDGCLDVENLVDSQVYDFMRQSVVGNAYDPTLCFDICKSQFKGAHPLGDGEVPEPVKKRRRIICNHEDDNDEWR